MTDKINELMRLADEYADARNTCWRHVEISDAREALKATLEAALKDCRNATLEEAALKFDSMDTGGAGYFAEEPADILRSMKS